MVRLLLRAATVLACAGTTANARAELAAAACPQSDPAAVVQTLNRLYAAAGAHDAEGVRSVTSSDFAVQEGGAKVNGETGIQRLVGAPVPAADAVPTAEAPAADGAVASVGTAAGRATAPAPLAISDPEVHILCDSAWATFRAPVALDGAHAQSAVLNYQDDGWRVRFLNASVPSGAEASAPRAAAARRARVHSGRSAHARPGTTRARGKGEAGAAHAQGKGKGSTTHARGKAAASHAVKRNPAARSQAAQDH